MSVLDKFLNAMKLNDDDGFDDDDFLDDDIDDFEEQPKKRFMSRSENEDDLDDLSFETRKPQPKVRKPEKSTSSKISPMRPVKKGSALSEVVVIKPHSMEDARDITETLLSNCTVVLNMEGLDLDIAQRIIDFSSGSCFAIDGNLQKISNYIFIITPSSVDITGDIQDILNGAFEVPSLHTNF